ncbi:uroporphyrinogen-III synthase [Palleronia caenipelagi]|uniref:uroporphyrinogen-III synthase n=1 Tax=Palleronia caenipelagi TaxID=2489174 RepID=UPI001C8F787D|nr:uroporphyrinogen-III synthase [Palleronia caenipelagi]
MSAASETALILTRPAGASRRFAEQARLAGWRGPVLFSPVLDIEWCETGPMPHHTLILTSENGARAAARAAGGRLDGWHAIAVGSRTASVAEAAGAQCEVLGGSASALTEVLIARGGGPYLHVHGRHVTGDLGSDLCRAGIEADSVVAYDQMAVPLSIAVHDWIASGKPAVLPLFSRRSARLISAELTDLPSVIRVVGISAAALEDWPWRDTALIAKESNANAVLARLAGCCA